MKTLAKMQGRTEHHLQYKVVEVSMIGPDCENKAVDLKCLSPWVT